MNTELDELAAILRGERTPEPDGRLGALVDLARRHHVHLLLARRWPSADLTRELREAALVDGLEQQELARVLAALAREQIYPLIFKGAALARLIYPAPYLRPRDDVDLLVRKDDVETARRVFETLEYQRAVEVAADRVSSQFHVSREVSAGVAINLDVHWRVVSPATYANLVTVEELSGRAIPVPAIGPEARAPSLVDALWLACLHRVAHHYDRDDLIWLYDIHLLATQIDASGWRACRELVERTDTGAVVARGLELASAHFATRLPKDVRDSIVEPALKLGLTASTATGDVFLSGAPRELDVQWANFKAIPGLSARLAFIRDHLFPPAAYMRARYGVPAALIPFAYAYRMCRGLPKWLRRRDRRT